MSESQLPDPEPHDPASSAARAPKAWASTAWLVFGWLGLGAGLAYELAARAARDGFMPLDQSICFDGGWRVLSGEVPLRDYLAPNGFTVHALQALFFAVGGVNWSAYVLHAAVFNALAVVAVFALLSRLGFGGWRAAPFMLATAVVFYPPFGPPYMDTHAFFFSLVAFTAALAACAAESERVRRWSAWSVGPLLALAYFSKQIPSVFFLPMCLGACAFARDAKRTTFKRMLLSLAATAVVLLLSALALGVDFALIDLYMRQLPTEEGARRLGYVPGVGSVLRRFEETRVQLDLWSMTAVHLVGLPALAIGVATIAKSFREPQWRWRKALGAGVLAELLLLACLLFVAMTSNEKELGAPLVFVALGAAAASVVEALRVLRPGARMAGVFLTLSFAAIAARDAFTFHERVVETRLVNGLAPAANSDVAAQQLPDALAGLEWRVPELVKYTPDDLRELTAYLRGRDGSFFLVGDCSVLYGITGKPSVFPALWFHPGLTFPSTADERFAAFEERLLERFDRFDVRTVVVEPRVWIGDFQAKKLITLEAFPRVAEHVSERRASERSIGAFRVIELR